MPGIKLIYPRSHCSSVTDLVPKEGKSANCKLIRMNGDIIRSACVLGGVGKISRSLWCDLSDFFYIYMVNIWALLEKTVWLPMQPRRAQAQRAHTSKGGALKPI